MQVSFVRTGKRRYAVRVDREQAADVVMDPAPGYDDHIPHDLVHFDRLARRWHALGVGGRLELEWPWPERRRARSA